MTHKGKVVVDQQGRVLGKDGKLLRDKKTGNFVYIDKDVKNKKKAKGPQADSGEVHRKNAKAHKNVESTSVSRLPFSKRNVVAGAAKHDSGQMSAADMAALSSHIHNKENAKSA